MNKETIYSAKNQKSNQGRIMPRSPHRACVSRIQFTASHNDIIIVIAIIIIIITVEQQESIPLLHTATMFCTMQFHSMHLKLAHATETNRTEGHKSYPELHTNLNVIQCNPTASTHCYLLQFIGINLS